MTDTHHTLALLGVTVNIAGYLPYYIGIFRKQVKPHLFTWFLWGMLTVIACVAQIIKDGGAGAWVTAVAALNCFLISLLALRYGEKERRRMDYICLFSAFALLPLWYLTKNAFLTVLIVILIDIVAGVPTLLKSWHKPHEESVTTYLVFGFSNIIGLLALTSKNPVTILFPLYLIIMNFAFSAYILWRRHPALFHTKEIIAEK